MLLHHKEQLGGIFEQSFGLVHSLTALLPHKKGGDLFLLSQFRKTKENRRLVLPRKERHGSGVFGHGSILFDEVLRYTEHQRNLDKQSTSNYEEQPTSVNGRFLLVIELYKEI